MSEKDGNENDGNNENCKSTHPLALVITCPNTSFTFVTWGQLSVEEVISTIQQWRLPLLSVSGPVQFKASDGLIKYKWFITFWQGLTIKPGMIGEEFVTFTLIEPSQRYYLLKDKLPTPEKEYEAFVQEKEELGKGKQKLQADQYSFCLNFKTMVQNLEQSTEIAHQTLKHITEDLKNKYQEKFDALEKGYQIKLDALEKEKAKLNEEKAKLDRNMRIFTDEKKQQMEEYQAFKKEFENSKQICMNKAKIYAARECLSTLQARKYTRSVRLRYAWRMLKNNRSQSNCTINQRVIYYTFFCTHRKTRKFSLIWHIRDYL